MLTLTILTILLILVFSAVLLFGAGKIMWSLETMANSPTSSPGSILAKIRWGVRAIEGQTAGIEPGARRLNTALARMEQSLADLRQATSDLAGRTQP